MIYDILLTAIGLSPGRSSTVNIYTQTVHRTTQNKQYIEQHNNLGECGPCPVLARFTLVFALKLRKKHEELRKKHEELRKKHEELKKKHEELRKKHEELRKKHEELRKKHDN